MILPDITAAVGRTALCDLRKLSAGLPGRVVGKLEL